MKSLVIRTAIAVLGVMLVVPFIRAQDDREGCGDYPLLSRMSGFHIERCKDEAFSSHKFQTPKGNIPIEGHLIFLEYRRPDTEPKVSNLEITRNYTNAVTAIGGEVTYEGRYSASMKAIVGDQEIWIEVLPGVGRSYQLYVIEKQAMVQQVVADAAALLADLDRVGHTVLHGILFDTDKAVVKQESEAALTEIAKLLRENPEMTAFIVGHTDMTGSFEHNMDLSNRRAAAVVEALVANHGISSDRLTPRGVGPLAPIGSNETEAGRALNRRVELVKR
jgi:outer membrane protein OmpA-like peptidoglycan-associated protein